MLLCEIAKKNKPKAPPKRGKGTLWFDNKETWHYDVFTNLAPQANLVSDDDKNVYANDINNKYTFGVWFIKKNKGVTFDRPRPVSIITNNTKFTKIL
jgi:hypothetical protein